MPLNVIHGGFESIGSIYHERTLGSRSHLQVLLREHCAHLALLLAAVAALCHAQACVALGQMSGLQLHVSRPSASREEAFKVMWSQVCIIALLCSCKIAKQTQQQHDTDNVDLTNGSAITCMMTLEEVCCAKLDRQIVHIPDGLPRLQGEDLQGLQLK